MKTDLSEFPRSSLFRLHLFRGLSEHSLLTARFKKPLHQPDVHVVVPILDELKGDLHRKILEQILKGDHLLLKRLGNRKEIKLQELAPTNVEEFL
jgi:hypothetical protein